MSSYKNASKSNQKVHRERHQPERRKHLGLLEKKKDYKIRAKDYAEKEATLKTLRKKAADRNPDEFYFHMVNSRLEGGEHHELEKEEEDTVEQIQLMQTQDIRYVQLKLVQEQKKIERLRSQLHLLDAKGQPRNTHTFFVDNKREAKNFDVAKKLNTHPALLGRKFNRPTLENLGTLNLGKGIDEETVARLAEERQEAYEELSLRIAREKELNTIYQKQLIKRHLQDKKTAPPKRMRPPSKDAAPVYKWRQERKR